MLDSRAETYGFVEFRIEDILDNSVTDFELFLLIDQEPILYSGEGYVWYREELKGLVDSGRRVFYIKPNDVAKSQMYLAMQRLPVINQNLSPSHRILAIDDIGARLTACIFEGELTESCVNKAKELAKSLVECISEDPSSVNAISGLADYDAYTYHHSVRVAAYGVAIGIGMGISDQGQLFDLALGGIFHDVGKKEIPHDLLNKQGVLTQDEWALMRSHPVSGSNLLENAKLSYVSREIVLHHHERRNGSGYPHGLQGSELIEEVQIAALADIFDALTSSRSYQRKRTRFEALTFIKSRLLGVEVNAEAYKALVGVLAG